LNNGHLDLHPDCPGVHSLHLQRLQAKETTVKKLVIAIELIIVAAGMTACAVLALMAGHGG
jgi:hypothetical protein